MNDRRFNDLANEAQMAAQHAMQGEKLHVITIVVTELGDGGRGGAFQFRADPELNVSVAIGVLERAAFELHAMRRGDQMSPMGRQPLTPPFEP